MLIRLEVLLCALSVCPLAFVHGQGLGNDIEASFRSGKKRRNGRSFAYQIGTRSPPNFGSRHHDIVEQTVNLAQTVDLVEAVKDNENENRELADNFDEGEFWESYLKSGGGQVKSMPDTPPTPPPVQTTHRPTYAPTATPSYLPSPSPTDRPDTTSPTAQPTKTPTGAPTERPSATLTGPPTQKPSVEPVAEVSSAPTAKPQTNAPVSPPTFDPSIAPAITPTDAPTCKPICKYKSWIIVGMKPTMLHYYYIVLTNNYLPITSISLLSLSINM